MNERIELAIVYGSTREGRLCDRIVEWVSGRVADHASFVIDLIDPATLGLPRRHERKDGAAVRALKARVGRADAFIVVTPEYNHGYPAALKQVIDSVYEEWQAKPVAFVSYGGASGGLRAVEQLRQVFAELYAVAIRDTISFADVWGRFDAAGRLRESQAATDAMGTLLAQLTWWAKTLRDARRDCTYGLVRA